MDEPIRKKHRRWPWVVLIIILLIPLVVIGWTGLFHIPVVSAIFGTSKPIDLGVEVSEAALATAQADNPMDIKATPGEFGWMRNKTYSGTVPIDDTHSSAEVTSFIDYFHGDGHHVRDIQVKFVDGGLEASAFVTPYIKAPVYVKVGISRTSSTSVDLDLQSAKVGRLKVPAKYFDDIEREAERIVNREIANVDGFSIDELTYTDGSVHFKGTLPKAVSLGSGEQSVADFLE